MSILTKSARLRSGTYTLHIDLGGAANVETDLLDISDLTYEFDVQPVTGDIKTAAQIVGNMRAVIGDTLQNASSAYDSINSEIGAWTLTSRFEGQLPRVRANLIVDPADQTKSTFKIPFAFDMGDVSLDYKSKRTSITLKGLTSNVNVTNVFEFLDTADYYEYNEGVGFQVNAVPAGVFINSYMQLVSAGTAPTAVINPAPALNNFGYMMPRNYPIDHSELVDRNVAVWVTNYAAQKDASLNFVPAEQVMRSLLGMEGSFYGYCFGTRFVNWRSDKNYVHQFSNADLESFDIKRGQAVIQSINVNATATNANSYMTGTSSAPYYIGTGKKMVITFTGFDEFARAGEWIASTNVVEGRTTNVDLSNISNQILEQGIRQYELSTQAASAYKTTQQVEFTAFDALSFLPYQAVNFAPDVPRATGKVFRPTSIAYDFKGDRVRISAYLI